MNGMQAVAAGVTVGPVLLLAAFVFAVEKLRPNRCLRCQTPLRTHPLERCPGVEELLGDAPDAP